jgi:hypothetical protein
MRRERTRIVAGPPTSWSPAGVAKQWRQLGDVRSFDPASALVAAQISTCLIGVALANLATLINGDLPGIRGRP